MLIDYPSSSLFDLVSFCFHSTLLFFLVRVFSILLALPSILCPLLFPVVHFPFFFPSLPIPLTFLGLALPTLNFLFKFLLSFHPDHPLFARQCLIPFPLFPLYIMPISTSFSVFLILLISFYLILSVSISPLSLLFPSSFPSLPLSLSLSLSPPFFSLGPSFSLLSFPSPFLSLPLYCFPLLPKCPQKCSQGGRVAHLAHPWVRHWTRVIIILIDHWIIWPEQKIHLWKMHTSLG